MNCFRCIFSCYVVCSVDTDACKMMAQFTFDENRENFWQETGNLAISSHFKS